MRKSCICPQYPSKACMNLNFSSSVWWFDQHLFDPHTSLAVYHGMMQIRVKDCLRRGFLHVSRMCLSTNTLQREQHWKSPHIFTSASVFLSDWTECCQRSTGHANNHLLTLSEFALVKANYHLKMSCKGLWARSLHLSLSLSRAVFRVETRGREKGNGKRWKSSSWILLLNNCKIYFVLDRTSYLHCFSNLMTFKSISRFPSKSTCLNQQAGNVCVCECVL